jgi:hypothetical protein
MADPTNLDWFKAASPLLSSVLGGGGQPPNTAISSSGLNNSSPFDSSNWTVATGKASASAQVVPWYVYGLAGLALFLWYKHK